jgi:hypothetical protein
MQAWEALATHSQDGSGATILEGASTWAEVVATDALLGTDINEVDGTEHWSGDATGGPFLGLGGVELRS